MFLARLFLKKTTRYCHSSCVVVVQKLGHFVISLSLLKIFTETRTSCSLRKGELIPIGEVTLKIFLAQLCPFFDLELAAGRWHPHAVLLLWAWQPSCSLMQNHFIKLACPFVRRPHAKSGENCSSGFREDI